MGRTLGGDFEDDDLGGSLDLGSGSIASHHAGSAASPYDGGGVDFDDPFAEDAPSGPLELDLPSNSATALRSKAPTAPAPPLPPPAGGPAVPDLDFPQPPPSAARVSGMIATQQQHQPQAPSHSHGAPSFAQQPAYAQQPSYSQQPAYGPPPSSSSPMMSGPPSSQRQPQMSGPPSSSPSMSGGPPASFAAPSSKPSAAAQIARYPAPPPAAWRAPLYALQVIRRQLELRTDLESLRRRRSPDVALYEAALRTYDARTFRLGLSIDIALLAVFTIIFFMPVILRFTRSY